MAAPTYATRGIVLRKTKLGEADLICTLLACDGSQLRVMAKGARKPQSTFASRLELYSEVDLLCARGRSLDVVKEARLISGHETLRTRIEHASGAACMAELLERITQANLVAPRLFDLTHTALCALGPARVDQVPLLTAAHLLKAFSLAGLRPSLATCVGCGANVGVSAPRASATVRFSAIDGGVVCDACASRAQSILMPAGTIQWASAVIASTFSQISAMDADVQVGIDLIQLCQQWASAHIGAQLKSARFLLTCGLF